ncbi:DUF4352 domain-containing protein [Streptomyces sp. NPDC049040]|uniref:DUF4352 domain-containing protein n=1 Tax=Streptomyces sp. NPDC049040 TaxID=3365593 RepID=UPI003715F163
MRSRVLLPVVCAAAALALLTGCGGKTGTVSMPDGGTADGSATGAAAGTGAAKPPAASSAPAEKKAATAVFGATYTYTDGLAVTVSQVSRFTPSDTSAGSHPGDTAIILTVKIHNGTAKTFDTGLVTVDVKAGAEGEAAQAVFDSEKGVGEGFSGTVVPGSSATARFAWDIPKGATGRLDVEVSPDLATDYAGWHWVGQLP